MQDFWSFVSLITALFGFVIVAAALLFQGESVFPAATRAVLVGLVLWIVQNYLRGFLGLTGLTDGESRRAKKSKK